jgi:hypothetical protein
MIQSYPSSSRVRSVIDRGFIRNKALRLCAFSLFALACSAPDDDGLWSPAGAGGSGHGGSTTGGAGGVSVPQTGGRGTNTSVPMDDAPSPLDTDVQECHARAPRDPGGIGTEGSSCCVLDTGTCTDPSEIADPVLAAAYGHDSCEGSLKCVPSMPALADAGALGAFDPCTWTVGDLELEGRCLPGCFVQGHPSASFLKQGSCSEHLVCAPCFNPIDGATTGACRVAPGDAPVDPAPPPFAECGAPPPAAPPGPPGGLCAPADLVVEVDNAAIAALEQLDCRPGELCAPALKVKDTRACFEPCESAVADLLGDKYRPGGCVPSYVVQLVEPAAVGQVDQGSCAAGELCAPCLNPLKADAPTGACQ